MRLPSLLSSALVAASLTLAACGGSSPAPANPTGNQGSGTTAGALPPVGTAADFDYGSEFTGAIRFGIDEAAATAALGEPAPHDPAWEEGATGEWVLAKGWPAAGITLTFRAATSAGPFTVAGISLAAPSTLKTIRGIGLGSTEAEVREAYGPAISEDEQTSAAALTVGTPYGGLFFEFEGGKVVSLYAGPNGE